QASCWNDVAFIPATNEKQYQVKSRHLKRNGNIASSFYYFMLYYSKKIARKHFSK
ncbi:glycosyltransferase family 8 C-terminal domain-containing protein, partial [Klebsiella pneumoniae]